MCHAHRHPGKTAYHPGGHGELGAAFDRNPNVGQLLPVSLGGSAPKPPAFTALGQWHGIGENGQPKAVVPCNPEVSHGQAAQSEQRPGSPAIPCCRRKAENARGAGTASPEYRRSCREKTEVFDGMTLGSWYNWNHVVVADGLGPRTAMRRDAVIRVWSRRGGRNIEDGGKDPGRNP